MVYRPRRPLAPAAIGVVAVFDVGHFLLGQIGQKPQAAAHVLVGLVALLHLYFLVLEMFLWDKPAGLRAFGQTPEQARSSKVLAANQGLYNGFLAVGLLWGAIRVSRDFMIFFLLCVIVAGWTTANPTIYRAGLAFQGMFPKMARTTGTINPAGTATAGGGMVAGLPKC